MNIRSYVCVKTKRDPDIENKEFEPHLKHCEMFVRTMDKCSVQVWWRRHMF